MNQINKQKIFLNRESAGRELAKKLEKYKDKEVIILAIPRGGVPVGYQVAKFLNKKLDVVIPRKLPIPYEPEAGFGAVTSDGTIVLNERLVKEIGIEEDEIKRIANEVIKEIKRREKVYRKDRPFPDLKNKTAIIIDDGLASGYTMIAAIKMIRKFKPQKITVAVPTCSYSAYKEVKKAADEIVSLVVSKEVVFAVANFYEEWTEMTDEEVVRYLSE